MKRIMFVSILLFCIVVTCSSQKVIKVACVGNSITAGYGLQNPGDDSYPAVLGRLLGKGYEVRNFGVSATTLLLKGDYPYMLRPSYQEALQFEPDIVTIKLGTNDSKPQNWKYKKYFARDMSKMIRAFQKLKSHPQIYLCYPATVYAVQWGINNRTIEEEIIPIIDKVAAKYKLPIIDVHKATQGLKTEFPDNVHPDKEGAIVIARCIYGKISYPILKSAL